MGFTPRRFFAILLLIVSARAMVNAQGPRQPFSRVAVTITPDRADWTYRPGDAVSFRIDVLRDGHPLQGATVKYSVGPEMLPPSTEAIAVVGSGSITVAGGTMTGAGFLRLVATVDLDGRTYRGVGTAGFSPDRIQPTQSNPPDFDAFWDGERQRLAALPIDARWTPLSDYGTAEADC
jgi:cephalosporin-C deacetylase